MNIIPIEKTRLAAILIFLLSCLGSQAQVNVQLHYDFGRHLYPHSQADRQKVTATLEQYRPDRLGSIFYFVDFDFYNAGMKGAYLEFSREFNIKNGFAAHIEYDGGMTTGKHSEYGSQFQHALLVGPAYNCASSDFRRTLSLQLLYKQYFKGCDNKAYPSFQATIVWGLNFGPADMFTFSGYFDFWRDRTPAGDVRLSLAGEPQFWFNLYSLKGLEKTGLSVGTEIELSNNFVFPTSGTRTFFCNPTIGIKWTMR